MACPTIPINSISYFCKPCPRKTSPGMVCSTRRTSCRANAQPRSMQSQLLPREDDGEPRKWGQRRNAGPIWSVSDHDTVKGWCGTHLTQSHGGVKTTHEERRIFEEDRLSKRNGCSLLGFTSRPASRSPASSLLGSERMSRKPIPSLKAEAQARRRSASCGTRPVRRCCLRSCSTCVAPLRR